MISHRDLRSLQALDLWLRAVDTNEVMPLFESKPKEYVLPGLSMVDWSSEPQHLHKIVQEKDLSQLTSLRTPLKSNTYLSGFREEINDHYYERFITIFWDRPLI